MTTPPEAPAAPLRARIGRLLARHAWMGLVGLAAVVAAQAVDFRPPPRVRDESGGMADLVGEATQQEFSDHLDNPQAVQVRATLRMYDADKPLPSDDEVDGDSRNPGRLLSQPVITTIYGMNATMDQTVRLDGGRLEIDVAVEATPRLGRSRGKNKLAPIVLEHDIQVRSRHHRWWDETPKSRIHYLSHGFLAKVEEQGHRMVFTVDDSLFTLDLELWRPETPPPALARTK